MITRILKKSTPCKYHLQSRRAIRHVLPFVILAPPDWLYGLGKATKTLCAPVSSFVKWE